MGAMNPDSEMRRVLRTVCRAVVAVATVSLSSMPSRAQTPAARPLVLVNANILDPSADAPIRNATIVVTDGRITAIGTTAATPANAEVIDLKGRWVLPGFMDAHTHIRTLAAAKRALESGVTTVRSASTPHFEDVAIRALALRGVIPGPDMIPAGLFVTPDLGETLLSDPRLAALAGGVTSPDALRALVRIDLDRGALVIKTRGTDRAGLPNTDPRKQVYSEAQLHAVVDEAAKGNAPVMCHAHGDEGAYACVAAGVKSIEHGTFLADSTLALMAKKGTFLVPTYTTVRDLTDPGGDYDDPILRNRGLYMLPIAQQMVKHARAAGVKIATGVDTDYGDKSTSRIAHEIIAFVEEMGFPPRDALRAATSVSADLLGLGLRTGALRVGYDADLIVLPGNPLEDIRVVQDVQVVIAKGRVALNRLPFGIRG
jgi:imidazolonepropionase-like amidohydrolase